MDNTAHEKQRSQAIERIRKFKPHFLVVALGYDIAKGDPTGTWSLNARDFEENSRMIGAAGYPTLFVQAGGYRVPMLARNAEAFFRGFADGARMWLTMRSSHKSAQAGYNFIFAEFQGILAGYCCFGPIPLTRASFDLYWIAVLPNLRGCGLERRLMEAAEASIRNHGGTRVYADTSSRGQDLPTRAFYEAVGFCRQAYLPDFYTPVDGKIFYCKGLV